MDRDFILQYLKLEHLRGNSELTEIAEHSGMEFVKELLREYPSMRVLYVPTLQRNRELMLEVIRANKDKMSPIQLARKTGLSVKRVRLFLRELEMK
ncbi:MAG: hypothetical protein N2517_09335 [Ignavibacteria bacterium]|nr:hypothetical protein [Ignavibacteria bacterium]